MIATVCLLGLVAYACMARRRAQLLRRGMAAVYGDRILADHQTRRSIRFRAVCWFVPLKLFHWRELWWQKRRRALRDQTTTLNRKIARIGRTDRRRS